MNFKVKYYWGWHENVQDEVFKTQRTRIHYFNLLFPGDVFESLIGDGCRRFIVHDIGRDFHCPDGIEKNGRIEVYTSELNKDMRRFFDLKDCILVKRPFYNWFKFIWCLITKTY